MPPFISYLLSWDVSAARFLKLIRSHSLSDWTVVFMGAQMTTPYLLDTSRPLARAFLTIYLRIHRLVLINFLPALSQVYYAAPSLSWGRFTKSSGLFPTPDTHNVIISTLCTIHYIIVYLIHLVNVFITCDWFMIWSSLNQKTWKLINWQDLQLCIWLINNNSWSKSVVSVSQLGLLRGWFKKNNLSL